jgi:putative transposase
MMPRIARIVIPGCPHHITQRGNHSQRVFFADAERDFYLQLLCKYFIQFKVDVAGYALMSNHVHHVLMPALPTSLAKRIGRLHNDFARWQQIQQGLTGHLWQNRYFSCPLDEDHFWEALRYVELNPVRAGLVQHAWDWPWSSARAHVTGIDESGMINMDLWKSRMDANRWKKYLEEGIKLAEDVERIRSATRTGRPLGSEDFFQRLEVLTGRGLQPKKREPKPGSVRRKTN